MDKLPETWCVKITPENKDELGKWKLKQRWNNPIDFIKTCRYVEDDGAGSENKNACCTEISWDDFKKLVLKEGVNSVFPVKLKTEDVKAIIDVACDDWKRTLSNKWGEDVLIHGYVSVDESFYNEMSSASNEKQQKVINKAFNIKEMVFNVDSIIRVNGSICNGLFLITDVTDERVFVVGANGEKYDFHVDSYLAYNCVHASPAERGQFEDERKVNEDECGNPKAFLKEGTLCFIGDKGSKYLSLRYADGNGRFYNDLNRSGITTKWQVAIPVSGFTSINIDAIHGVNI